MDIELNVEYLQGDITINRTMQQNELAILLNTDVVLLSVNKETVIYRKKARL
ncbi:MAG: hypothetical protein ACERKZ_20630 [Lachnotalea sp.]